MSYLINAIRGFCMALADSVPGVSGGTIAFVLGFYDKFINSLDMLVFGNKKEKKESIIFLIKLGIGWIIGMMLAVLILTSLFQNHIYQVSSVFLGFIVFSLPIIIKEEKNILKGKYKNLLFMFLGVLIVTLITYFNPIGSNSSGVDISNLNLSLALYIFVSAMISISAMILPGISGSTLLLIFGLYIPIISAIKELLHFNFSYFGALVVFGFGILTGIILIIKLVKVALKKYRSQMMYLIVGLMIGSLYAIVMGPTTLENPLSPMSLKTFNIFFFLLGGGLIFGLEKLKSILKKKKIEE